MPVREWPDYEQARTAAKQAEERSLERLYEEGHRQAAALTERMRSEGWLTDEQTIVFVVEDAL